ncbi:polysaccharide pyruvyl transferase family protein [Agromyces sp. LHK192]|uniref:polysaccharide pyruvyl transferase family protein n=1 Tax=Agromyces sp. LHK192 TaxID=2498704 RepID=UPI000FD88B26|nr:polysaccharide pyruvyl transferase family protein [Agromyces sp. LHK192]
MSRIVAAARRLQRRARARFSPRRHAALAVAAFAAPAAHVTSGSAPAPDHLVIAPPGHGNIGDAALLGAYLDRVTGSVLVVTRGEDDFDVSAYGKRVRVLALPMLLYGGTGHFARGVRELRGHVGPHTVVAVLGADIMDGAYHPAASVNRALIAAAAAKAGRDARILGFSWNAAPDHRAVWAMGEAAASGALLAPRDPISLERFRRDVPAAWPVAAADLVFTANRREPLPQALDAALAGAERPAVVNVSGLIAEHVPPGTYAAVVRDLLETCDRVVVLPHVSRPGADDLPHCRDLAGAFADDDRVVLVERLLTPPQVRELASRAHLVLTGRMHLAVMSLMAGVPAITMASQGKVEGLMALFGLPELCIEPGPALAEELPARVAAVLADHERIASRISERLPGVAALAERNFDALPVFPLGEQLVST